MRLSVHFNPFLTGPGLLRHRNLENHMSAVPWLRNTQAFNPVPEFKILHHARPLLPAVPLGHARFGIRVDFVMGIGIH